MKHTCLIFTCEHNGNEVPDEYKNLFNGYEHMLTTHRGFDLGIASLTEHFEHTFKVKVFKTKVTRLLVDVNRSLWRRTLFSEITKNLSQTEKEEILNKYYYSHRNAVANYIRQEINNDRNILHIALHSFTTVLNSRERKTEIGLLYNPERKNEKSISVKWKKELKTLNPSWRVRFNYPYRGKPDGLTAHFRRQYPDGRYLGVEMEINQKFVTEDGMFPKDICNKISKSFDNTIRQFDWL